MIIPKPARKTTPLALPPALSAWAWRVHEKLLRRPTFALAAELERSQYLSRQAIENLQLYRLRELLKTALAHSPWHARRIRQANIDPDRMTLEDFRRLPTMTKDDARLYREEIVWRGAPGGIFRYTTGGSTGAPLIFYFGRRRQAADAAGRIRARKWWGVEPGDREVLLWGAPVELTRTDWLKTVRDRVCNQLMLNAFAMSPTRMDRYLDTIQRFQPKVLYGYASSLALLAEHAEHRGRSLNVPELKVVFATGEPLYPYQREVIRRVFGAPVAAEYGARDAGLIALESPQGQLLVNSEWILLEILDAEGKPVAEGEMGEVVITNLASDAQPFIRYCTGDKAVKGSAFCRQGRGLEVLEHVLGRSTDFIVRQDGTIMHALALIYVLREIPGIKQFKIVQEALSRLQVQIVPDVGWQEHNAAIITKGLQQRLGPKTEVEIKYLDCIPPEKSGKFRYVVSQVER